MGPSPTYHPPEGEKCETSVEHGLPVWAEPAVGYCSRRPRPSPMWGSRFVGARAVAPWVGEQKPLGKTPPAGQPQSRVNLPTYLPASVRLPEVRVACLGGGFLGPLSLSLPQVYCDVVPWCSTSLNPLRWDIACTQVVCPDARTLCVLPWGAGARCPGV